MSLEVRLGAGLGSARLKAAGATILAHNRTSSMFMLEYGRLRSFTSYPGATPATPLLAGPREMIMTIVGGTR